MRKTLGLAPDPIGEAADPDIFGFNDAPGAICARFFFERVFSQAPLLLL